MLFQIFPSPCRCKNLLKITSNLLENLYLDRFKEPIAKLFDA